MAALRRQNEVFQQCRDRLCSRLRLLHRLRCPWRQEQTPDRRAVGRYGELVAASWLRSQGLRVLRLNFVWVGSGEIDIVCREGDTLVFVEVKSGTVEGPYPLAHKVDEEKRRLIRRGARNWFHLLGRKVPHRFDIVEVHLRAGERPRVHHIREAFPPMVTLCADTKRHQPQD